MILCYLNLDPKFAPDADNCGVVRYALSKKQAAIEGFQRAADLYQKEGKLFDY